MINGTLAIGTLVLDGLDNSINAVGKLKLQPLALAPIEFVGGAIEMDQDGNLDIKKGVITGNDEFRGSAILTAGETSVRVERDWEGTPASITITPSYNTTAWVTDKSESGFTIRVDKAPAENQSFDWLAVW